MKKILVMLCAALLAHSTAYASDLSDWAAADYESAARSGIISSHVAKNNLQGDITREEFCRLIVNLYKNISEKELYTPETIPFEDTDCEEIAQCYALGIVNGKSETEFDPEGLITREEMAKMIVNTLKSAEINLLILRSDAEEIFKAFEDSNEVSEWAFAEMAIALKYSIISGMSENTISPKTGATRQQAIAIANRVYEQYVKEKSVYAVPEFEAIAEDETFNKDTGFKMSKISGALKYYVIVKDSEGENVAFAESPSNNVKLDTSILEDNMKYTVSAGVKYKSGIEAFSNPVEVVYKGTQQTITVVKTDRATVTAKEKRVFPGGFYFATEEEAKQNMVPVVIDVWTVDKNGEKVAAKKTVEVNQYLAEDVQNIFKKIFEDPSKFPIKSIGGYAWRTTAFGKVSQHSYGTCIDINPDENYYCHSEDGSAITGTYWKPYEDVFSITPDGAVVAAFAEFGWIWGGSWDGSVKDYMHFSYLGK